MGLRGIGARPRKPEPLPDVFDMGWPEPPPPPDLRTRAQKVIDFVEKLKITSGAHAGENFILRPWQKEIIRRVYDPTNEEGKRQVRTAALSMARKNGKSGLVAALALCHLCGPEAEIRGAVYSAAADRNQAAIIYREMKAMILLDEELTERINIRDFTKELEDFETGSVYAALSADAGTKHGLNSSLVIYDELAQAPDRKLYDVLETSVGARAEPLFWIISTQSSDPKHVMSEVVDYAKDVAAGVVDDPTFVGFIFEAPAEADPWDIETWKLANPALGDFRSLDELAAYAAKAKRLPARQAVFRNLYLNQRIDASASYISGSDWDACGDVVDAAELNGKRVFSGLDLGSTRDLTAFVMWFPDTGAVISHFWMPGDDLDDREKLDRAPYRVWRDAGLLTVTPGRAVDKRSVARQIAELTAPFDLVAIGYDRWRIEDFKNACEDDGLNFPLQPWGQGFKDMAPALDNLEEVVLSRQLHHGGNPILRWNIANAVLDIDPTGARKLNKRRARARIDGLQALAMAIGVATKKREQVQDWSMDLVLAV